MMRGPRSRAGLMAYPVVPPSERPMAHTSMPTRYGPSPGGTVAGGFGADRGHHENQDECADGFGQQVGAAPGDGG